MMKKINTPLGLFGFLLVSVLLSACGGTGGGSDTEAGIDGLGRGFTSSGSIDSVNSTLTVNDSEVDTSSANVSIDGEPGTAEDLQVGQVVIVNGSQSDNPGTAATAEEIRYFSNVIGPVSAINEINLTFTILGQTIKVDNLTVWGDEIESFGELSSDTVVRVSGLVASNGDIAATRVDTISSVASYQVIGMVTTLDSASTTFSINGLRVNYQRANPQDPVSEGVLVRITGMQFNEDNQFEAMTLQVLENDLGGSGQLVNLEGLITRFESSDDFDVSGFTITTGSETVVENGNLNDLNLDARVEVHGQLNNSGVVSAERIVIIHTGPERHQGSLAYYTPIQFTVETTEDDLGFWVSTKALGGRHHLYVHNANNQTPIAQCVEDSGNSLSVGGCPWSADTSLTQECVRFHVMPGREGLCYLENLTPGTWNIVLIALDPLDYEVEVYKRRLAFEEPEVISPNQELILNMRKGDRRLFRMPVDIELADKFLSIMLEGLDNDAQMQVYADLRDEDFILEGHQLPVGSAERCSLTSDDDQAVCWLANGNTENWYIEISSFVDKEYRLHANFVDIDTIGIGEEVSAQITSPQGTLYKIFVPETDKSLGLLMEDRSDSVYARVHIIRPRYIDQADCSLIEQAEKQCILRNTSDKWRYIFIRGDLGATYTFTTRTQTLEPEIRTLDIGGITDFEVTNQSAGVIATYQVPRGELGSVYVIGITELTESSNYVLTVKDDASHVGNVCEVNTSVSSMSICRVENDGTSGHWFIEVKSFHVGSYQIWLTEQEITPLDLGSSLSATLLPEDTLLGHLYKVKQLETGDEFISRLSNKTASFSMVGDANSLPTTEDFVCGSMVPSEADTECQISIGVGSNIYLLVNGESGEGYTINVQEGL